MHKRDAWNGDSLKRMPKTPIGDPWLFRVGLGLLLFIRTGRAPPPMQAKLTFAPLAQPDKLLINNARSGLVI